MSAASKLVKERDDDYGHATVTDLAAIGIHAPTLAREVEVMEEALRYIGGIGCTGLNLCVPGRWEEMCFACTAAEVLKGIK